MLAFTVILLQLGLYATLAQEKPDPRCVAKGCPPQTTCRVVTTCTSTSPDSCTLEAQCLENPPQFSHTGVCVVGDPILVMRRGALDDTHCGSRLPCPNGTYCNTELMDTYATCCMSDPDKPVKAGTCPANTYRNDDFCLDTCNNDGDCRMDEKCCEHGCNRECIPPKVEDLCDSKKCPALTYCQRRGMPPCSTPNQCWPLGSCVPCPPVCQIFCNHGNVMDPNGCPTCTCKPPPPPRAPAAPSTDSRSAGTRPGLGWPGAGSQGGQQQQWSIPFIPPWFWALFFM